MMVLQNQPCWIRAVEHRGELVVSHSPVLPNDDRAFNSVNVYLKSTCHEQGHQSSREDDTMMFGRAIVTTYRVYSRCPGAAVDHSCAVGVVYGKAG